MGAEEQERLRRFVSTLESTQNRYSALTSCRHSTHSTVRLATCKGSSIGGGSWIHEGNLVHPTNGRLQAHDYDIGSDEQRT